MNIFRELASGKHAVREEFVSAFLAYLLSPKMDHGLGYSFLSRLLVGIAEKNDIPALKELAARMRSHLWENIFEEGIGLPVVELEFRVPGNRYIDIVVKCEDWFILIENKIVQSSKTDGQLETQYKGFLEVTGGKELFKDNRVLMLYVVPAVTNGMEARTNREHLRVIRNIPPGEPLTLGMISSIWFRSHRGPIAGSLPGFHVALPRTSPSRRPRPSP